MAEFLGTVQLGGFYNNGAILPRPTKPWRYDQEAFYGSGVGDIPQMSGGMANYTIGNTPSVAANKLQWHKIKDGDKTLLICDRVILAYVSWDDLNAQGYVAGKTVVIDGTQYKCRLLAGGSEYRSGNDSYSGGSPTNNEWDRFITNEEAVPGLPVPIFSDLDANRGETDATSAHNQFWNWLHIYSWCPDTFNGNAAYRPARGRDSARCWNRFLVETRVATVGFRPVLEVLNTAPTMPSSLTIPAQINGGSTITLSWGAAADAEDNLEGYKVERSLDGGTTWTQIYQGGLTSTTNIVPFGSESVMYRVKAYDAEGLESGWKTSAQVTVINNTAPTVPGNLTVPEAVQGGQPLAISWGASSDGENNLAGYCLERQVDGGDWEAVYSGPELSFTDQITKGWQTVAYRIRAYDTANAYSGFAVSEAREVNNNTPPAITCEYPANTPLGVKSEGFGVDYSVEDEEGDAVIVTEAVDGAALRTFAVELGEANRFTLDGEAFMKLLNGRHTLSITAADSASSAVHSLSFEKLVTAASVTLERPMEADGPISVCVLSVSGFIPADADYRVEVTNNALDGEPVWEDCTAAVRAGANHVFENQTAANGFAFNFRLNVERGESGIGGYITSVQGGFQ
ncbi:MAG: fibronectin type III domain-containing protein [Clostridiales bacterium]|nr:fibronectin type III domain-containing protein [Clostridiales bacterium]